MSFQKVALFCLIAIAVGSAFGLLEAKLNLPPAAYGSRELKEAGVYSQSTASATFLNKEEEALAREKENGLGEFLTRGSDD